MHHLSLTDEVNLCPCGSQHRYAHCCEPLLLKQRSALTAEALMRSRYTAYCMGDLDYLITTHHPTQRQPDERSILRKSLQHPTWQGLTILATERGTPQDDTGMVEFFAVYQDFSGIQQLHERSYFVNQKGHWFYVSGDRLPPVTPRRNDPCWCGSGKKFKQCHGR